VYRPATGRYRHAEDRYGWRYRPRYARHWARGLTRYRYGPYRPTGRYAARYRHRTATP
jgi:hypothetical protein